MALLFFAVILFISGFVVSIILPAKSRGKIAQYEKERKNPENLSTYDIQRDKERIEEWTEKLKSDKRNAGITLLVSIVLAAVFLISSMLAIVPTGYTGIKTTFGKVENDVLSSGINFKLPWQDVVNMDNREQRTEFEMEAFSKDIQQVIVKGSINVNIDKSTAMDLYKNVGVNYPTILVTPRVYEDVKIIIARYTAETLVENRQICSDAIYELLKSELALKGINVLSFAIENIDFTDAFESAVEAKQVATQEKQKAQTEQERQTMEQKQQAERERIKAQAEADVKKIEADAQAYAVKVQAEAQADANKQIAETLSDPLIQYNLVNQWDGKLPVVSSDGSSIIDLRGMTE